MTFRKRSQEVQERRRCCGPARASAAEGAGAAGCGRGCRARLPRPSSAVPVACLDVGHVHAGACLAVVVLLRHLIDFREADVSQLTFACFPMALKSILYFVKHRSTFMFVYVRPCCWSTD